MESTQVFTAIDFPKPDFHIQFSEWEELGFKTTYRPDIPPPCIICGAPMTTCTH